MHSGTSPAPSPVRPGLSRWLVAAAWLLWSTTFVKYALVLPLEGYGIDYIKHRRAAEAVLEGRSPYVDENYLRFNYPEFAAWAFVFLAWVPEKSGETVWDLCNAVFLAGALVVVILGCRPEKAKGARAGPLREWAREHWHATAALTMGLFAPAFVGNHYANIEPFNLLLVSLLVAMLLRGRDTWAGFVLAALSLVKILPVLFLAPLWIARRRRVVWICLGCFAVYGIVLLATGWWRREWFLVTDVLPNLGFRYRSISNAPASILAQYWMPKVWGSKAAYDLATRIGAAAAFGAFAGVLALGWRGARASWRRGLSFAALSVVLMPPLFEYIHLIWTLPAYLLLVVGWVEGRVSHRLLAGAGALWVLTFVCRYMQELSTLTEPMLPRHIATFFVIGLWVIAAARLFGARNEAEEEGNG